MNKIRLINTIACRLLLLTAILCSIGCGGAQSPIEGSTQLFLVIADTIDNTSANLYAFERAGGEWGVLYNHPVVIGRTGMAWGVGLHSDNAVIDGEPVKEEGDGKTPMGVFTLPKAYGYLDPANVNTDFPYEQATNTLICVDDNSSGRYNEIFDWNLAQLDGKNLPSHENMRRDDDLYLYTVVVGHNIGNPVSGAGSCIFLHLWGGPESHTAGCTAMSEQDMLKMLYYLDPEKKPLLVQLTVNAYDRLRDVWHLPAIPVE